MKLNRLKSVVNQIIRGSSGDEKGYMLDPFEHYTPEIDFEIDLITGIITPDCEGDDVERYYKSIISWFHEVLPKEGIPIDVIDSAILKITPEGKSCLVKAQGREFSSSYKFG